MPLAKNQSVRVIVAIVIALVGVLVAWRALRRTAPPASTTQAIPAPTPPKEVTKKDQYEVRSTPDTVAQAAARVADVIRAAPASIRTEAGVTQFQMNKLADRVDARLELVLAGADLRDVVAQGAKDGMEWSEPNVRSETRASFEHWQARWRFAQISADRAFVRVSDGSGDKNSYTMPRPWQRIAMRNVLRPKLANLPGNAQIVELVVPALTRASGSSSARAIPVDLGFSYYWNSEKQKWMGVNVTTYLANEDIKNVIPPP